MINLTTMHGECQPFNGALCILKWKRCSCQLQGCTAPLSETETATLKIFFKLNNAKLTARDSFGSVAPFLTHLVALKYCQGCHSTGEDI